MTTPITRSGSGGPKPAIVIAVVVALIAAAAGAFALTRRGTSSEASPTTTSAPESTTTTVAHRNADQVAADDATAHAITLQLGDMPPGWSAQPNELAPKKGISADHVAGDSGFTGCLRVSVPTLLLDLPTYVASDVMVDDQLRSVIGETTIYANDRAAKDDYDLLKNRHFMDCIGHVVDTSVAEGLGPRGVPPGVKLGPAYAADLGDIGNVHTDFVGIRATVPIQAGQDAERGYFDIVWAVKGRTVITLSFVTFTDAFTVDFEAALTNALVERAPAT